MLKQQITHFTLECPDTAGIECDTPISKYSVLSEKCRAEQPDTGTRLTAEFDVNAEMITKLNVKLRLHGASTGKVTLNGAFIGAVTELCRTSTFDVKPKLKIGKNVLVLELDGDGERELEAPLSQLYPKWRTGGTLEKVELLGFDKQIIDTVKARQEHNGEDVKLIIELSMLGFDESARAVATLVSPGGQVFYAAVCDGVAEITVKSANLWWPSGLGVQNLYKLCINLYCSGEIEDSYEASVALCRLEISSDDSGPYLSVNGESFFALGALYVPDGKAFVNPRGVHTLLDACHRANFNCILVSSSAYYPDTQFYDECGRLGLAVVRDFEDDRGGVYLPKEYADAVLDGVKEINFQSLPSVKTLGNFLEGDELNLLSPALEEHEERAGAALSILEETVKNYRYPYTMRSLIYLSQLIQAAELRGAALERRFAARGMLIYSRLNDFENGVSPAGVDVFGRWKAQQYAAKSVFSPIFVSVKQDGDFVKFSVSCNRRRAFSGNLTYSICDSENRQLFTEGVQVQLDALSSSVVLVSDIASEILGKEKEVYLSYSLTENSVIAHSGTLLFTNPKNFKFKKPNIKYEISGSGSKFWITLTSDVFAKAVELDFLELDASFEDNYFDITSEAPVRIAFTLADSFSLERLRREIRIRTLYDVGREENGTY